MGPAFPPWAWRRPASHREAELGTDGREASSDRPDLFVTYLDRARRWTARVDWSTIRTARFDLDRTNAFVDANDAEDRGLRLMDPRTDEPAITTALPES